MNYLLQLHIAMQLVALRTQIIQGEQNNPAQYAGFDNSLLNNAMMQQAEITVEETGQSIPYLPPVNDRDG